MQPLYRKAIQSIESSGGDYSLLGPVTKNGDRAYGAYQVMGNNIPEWTQRHLGRSMTPQEFLADKDAQDKVFDGQFGSYVDKYGNPQDAASAWFTGGPLSTGANKRDVLGTSGSGYVDKFNRYINGGSDSPGSLTTAFAPTEKKTSDMPALSADNALGFGALSPEPQKGLLGLNVSDNTYDGLMGIASSLSGISNPDQAKALIAQQAANKKVAGDTGSWSIHTFPNGQSVLMNSKRGMLPLQGNYAKPEADEYEKAAKIAGAKSNQDYGDSIAAAGANANGLAGDVATLKQVYSNPAVYQGQGGEWVQSARKLYAGITGDTDGAKNIADGDIAKALSNKLALKLVQDTGSGKLLPGSFSDSDREFVKQMTTSLNNSPEANQRLIAIYERTIQRAQEAELARQAHLDTNGGIYRPTIRGEIGQLNKKWADEDKARGEAEAKSPAATAAPAKANTNTFKTKSGVTWSVH
jgi:hypothetical protein